MIITETITINGREFIKNYSDEGKYVVREGVKYSEAIDPVGFDRVYTESEEYMEDPEKEISDDEFISMLEEVL